MSKYPSDGWALGQVDCHDCGDPMIATAYNPGRGEGWYLHWRCRTCIHPDIEIDWPFREESATAADLEAVGFRVEM
jgi:hypothetical protein